MCDLSLNTTPLCGIHVSNISLILLSVYNVTYLEHIPSLSVLTYAERLAMLNLETLELRRLHFDLIFYYKVFNHLTPFDPETVFTMHTPPPSLRCNSAIIKKPLKPSNKLISSIFYRNIDAWKAGTTCHQMSPCFPHYLPLNVGSNVLIYQFILEVR